MNSSAIRTAFLNYFAKQGHSIVPSSSLIPGNDPSLLFTNAGMVQFKDVFLGTETRSYKRATSSQRCVRAGGKHNDLENVGYTTRHHTFFEMLGNFSFGDYFKREAIQYAWEFLTKELGLAPQKLWVTVYKDDTEAANIWLQEVGIDPARFSRLDEKDNFWSMGDTGPCGPCTEIYYDHGPEIAGGPPGSAEADGDRYVEIWNLVFMQYNRDAKGQLLPLPKPSVDTGMGLERVAAVMQGVHSNYEIDLFQQLITAAAQLTHCADAEHVSLKVIADHIRSCAFLVMDGVVPANEGRGYVLRRIMRRALRHGHNLGARETFFAKLVPALVQVMGDAYPELKAAAARVQKILLLEEEQFARTLDQGLRVLEQNLSRLTGSVIPGAVVFQLYDTYGFPFDLTADIARERGLSLDKVGYEAAMAQQRQRAKAASQFVGYGATHLGFKDKTPFVGYEILKDEAQILALYKKAEAVAELSPAEEGTVVLDHTAFYAEAGGQIGDVGILTGNNGQRFIVKNTTKEGEAHLHHGILASGRLQLGDPVQLEVDIDKRQATALNHSATHLLHAALRQILGTHVVQKGSLVEPERLRFDFIHTAPITPAELRQIECCVNQHILANTPVTTELTDIETAQQRGAMALFGEKYAEEVRLLTMGDGFSVELCGGTHVKRTGDIGLFCIVSESGIAAGIRRIEAATGHYALNYINGLKDTLNEINSVLKSSNDSVADKVKQLIQQTKDLEKALTRWQQKSANNLCKDLLNKVINIENINVLTAQLEGMEVAALRQLLDQLKQQLNSAVIVLAVVTADKITLLAGVTQDLITRFHAGRLINHVAVQVGGKGGGKADMAQAGGTLVEKLPVALASVTDWVKEHLK